MTTIPTSSPRDHRAIARATPSARRLRRAELNDRGSLTVIGFFLLLGTLLFTALVVDGGGILSAREYAAEVAREAARAGADALTPLSLRTADPGQLQVDPAAAEQAAQRVLATAGLTGTVTVNGERVTVTAHARYRTKIASAFHLTTLTLTMSATAVPLPGGAP